MLLTHELTFLMCHLYLFLYFVADWCLHIVGLLFFIFLQLCLQHIYWSGISGYSWEKVLKQLLLWKPKLCINTYTFILYSSSLLGSSCTNKILTGTTLSNIKLSSTNLDCIVNPDTEEVWRGLNYLKYLYAHVCM